MTPFSQRNMDDLTRLRNKSFQMGDQVKPHRTNPDIMLVSAQSMSTDQVIAWYKVNLRTQTCTCKSFARWANCRHLCRAAWEVRKPANVIDFPVAA